MYSRKRVLRWLIIVLWIGLAAYPVLDAWSYYLTPLAQRHEHPLHEWYRPTGLIGHGLGIVGTLLIVIGVASYMLRKRWHRLHALGTLRSWLTFHIFLCTLGPFFVLLHTTFKVGNIVAIAFWSMAIVVISGIFGRYVYLHIPKLSDGRFLTPGDVQRAQQQLLQKLAHQLNLPPETLQEIFSRFIPPQTETRFSYALWKMLQFDWQRHRIQKQLAELLRQYGADSTRLSKNIPTLIDLLKLSYQAHTLLPLQRAFGYWHTLHIPLALTMLVVVIIHVSVAIAFGYTWIF